MAAQTTPQVLPVQVQEAHHHALGRKAVDAELIEDIQHSQMLAKDKKDIDASYFRSTFFIGTMVSMSLTVVSSYFGFAVPASVITLINADIGPSENASLYSIIWSLCNAVGLLLTGRLSDKFGRRYFVLGAGALAIVGGIVACTANTMNTLIGANVIIGLASGVHSSQTLFTGELIPHEYKFLAVAAILVPMVTSTGLAAFIARALCETRSWRWIYYIYLILVGVGWIMQIFVYQPPNFQQLHGARRTKLEEAKRIDFGGIFLLVAGLTLFLLGVSWGGNPQPWTSGRILGLVISGGITLVVFVIYEAYTPSPNPFIELRLFRNVRGFVCLNIISAAAGAMYIALSIIWPQQVAYVYSADNATWRDAAWMSTAVGWGIWSGIMVLFPFFRTIGHTKWQILALTLFSVAFTGALSSVDRTSKGKAIAFSFLTAFPIGWLETGTTLLVQLDVDDMDIGMAYAVLSGLRSVSGAVFTAVFVAILTSKSKARIASYVPPAVINAGLPESSLPSLFAALQTQNAAALAAVPGMTPEIQLAFATSISDAYASAFAYVYYAAIAVGATAAIAALFLKDYDKLLTDHVPRQLYRSGDRKQDLEAHLRLGAEKAASNEAA